MPKRSKPGLRRVGVELGGGDRADSLGWVTARWRGSGRVRERLVGRRRARVAAGHDGRGQRPASAGRHGARRSGRPGREGSRVRVSACGFRCGAGAFYYGRAASSHQRRLDAAVPSWGVNSAMRWTPPPCCARRGVADNVLLPAAMDVERSGRSRRTTSTRSPRTGCTGCRVARGRRARRRRSTAARVIEILASGCLSTAFVWLQHHGRCARRRQRHADVREKWLGPLCRGDAGPDWRWPGRSPGRRCCGRSQ